MLSDLTPTRLRVGALLLMLVTLAACGSAPATAVLPQPTATPVQPTAASEPTTAAPTATVAAAPSPEAATPTAETPTAEVDTGAVVFQIVPDQSEARFLITEELRGQPTTVIGTTRLVSGELRLDLADLSQSQIGAIAVDAGSLTTDNDFRNQAIRRFILVTSQFPTITFTPTAITGLSGAAAAGQPLSFQITGDLTIRDVTQTITFAVSAAGASTTQLSGTATATVQRSAFNLLIPSVPQVANVSEDVLLTLDFVAQAAQD